MTKELDAIIFGATGFSGQIVVQDAVEILKDFKWGIAGRNEARLKMVLKEVGSKVGQDLSKIPIILADVKEQKSIEAMAGKCKVVLNCCGPYNFYGEIVVKACIEAGTHHVDISGEPQYIDKMQLKYNDLAREKGAYVVSTCAFESIPCEMGVVYAERQFPGTPNSVEMFWENTVDYKDKSSKALLHYGTWESAIYAMKYAREMFTLQRQMNREKLPSLKPKLWINPLIQRPDFLDSYCIPFPGVDRNIVQRSQRLLYEFEQKRPVQFESYVGFRSLLAAILVPLYVILIAISAQFKCTRKLLLKFPNIFTFGIMTHQGPTPANMNAQHFTMTFRTKGWAKGQSLSEVPRETMLTRVSGYNPCYGLTSVALISTAKTILLESDKMPNSGGVLPPGAAFAKTSLIEELSKHKYGLKFEVLK